MNRILEVNEKYGYALLEPGSPTSTSTSICRATDSSLMLDCPTWGGAAWSVTPWTAASGTRRTATTSVADGPGSGPAAGRGDAHRHGRTARQRTRGSCSPTGSARSRTACSPSRISGIVTKMGIALMQRPPASHDVPDHLRRRSDLEQIVDIMLPLRINMAPMQNVPVLRNIFIDAAAVSKRSEWYDGDGPMPARGDRADEVRDLELGLLELLRHPVRTAADDRDVLRDDQGGVRPDSRCAVLHERGTPEAGDRGAHVLHDRHKINNGIPSAWTRCSSWTGCPTAATRASRPCPRRTARTRCGSSRWCAAAPTRRQGLRRAVHRRAPRDAPHLPVPASTRQDLRPRRGDLRLTRQLVARGRRGGLRRVPHPQRAHGRRHGARSTGATARC